MSKVLSVYRQVHQLRDRFLRVSLGREALLVLIDEAEVFEQVYDSNAIENSTLTLEETEKILLQVDLDRFISERELFEARNLARVVSYIRTKAKETELSLDVMLLLHRMLIANIRDEIAGRFRTGNEFVRVGNYIAPPPTIIVEKLQQMLVEFQARVDESIIRRIARFHLSFEHIHPFVDGNGRIGRVLNNYVLIREGYVPINIKFFDRARYYQAFQEFDQDGKTSIMEEIVGRALTNSYHKRLAYLEERQIMTLNDYAKRNKLSHSNLINKAKRQTIEAFLEKNIWKIGA